MMSDRILLFLLLLAPTGAFMVHNTKRGLCVEGSVASDEVLLRRCNLDSGSQQWVWVDPGMLMNVASSRCLSALQSGLLRTQSCSSEVSGPGSDPSGLLWDCNSNRLISRNSTMLLSIDGRRLILSHESKLFKWRSLDGGDICQQKQRSKRASDDTEEFEEEDELADGKMGMTQEQREYLRWFYRTEDPTIWEYVLLGAAFVCLLAGFLLLGMGSMANKNRKKIAKYKAAAALAQMGEAEQLRVVSALREGGSIQASPLPVRQQLLSKSPPSNGELNELKAGSIVVTWKDGNTSCLYPEAKEEEPEELQVELQVEHHEEPRVEQQEEEHVEDLADEVVPDEPVKSEE